MSLLFKKKKEEENKAKSIRLEKVEGIKGEVG